MEKILNYGFKIMGSNPVKWKKLKWWLKQASVTKK